MPQQLIVTRKQALIATAFCAFFYLYPFPYYPKINNPNENVRFYMTASIVERGTYAIDAMRARWGWVGDAAANNGSAYSVKAPGTSFLGIPGYALYYYGIKLAQKRYERTVALRLCRLTASILPTLFFLFFFYRWLARQTSHPLLRDTVYFSVAIGSLFYGYAVIFVSHTLSAAAGFGAFMMLFDIRRDPPSQTSRKKLFVAGLLTASATLFEYPGLVASLILSIYALFAVRPLSRLVHYAFGGLAPTLVVMHFQWRAFGSPFTPGHLMVENPAFRSAHLEGLYGAVGPSVEALYGLLLDPAAGLFPLTPIMLFSLFGFGILLRNQSQRLDSIIALSIAALTLLTICSMNNWRGGWTIGPRYLALVVPFAAWGSLVCLERVAKKLPRLSFSLALGCTAAAIVASGLPSAYYPHIPPDFTRPLSQLFSLLIAHDYAPYNWGNLFGSYGTRSMWPLGLAAVLLILFCLKSVYGFSDRLKIVVTSTCVALCLLWPLLTDNGREEPAVVRAVDFVTQNWSPEGHDLAARLFRDVENARPEAFDVKKRRLIDVLMREGRFEEARRIGSSSTQKPASR
ncbi:MAG: hypothetical protein JXA30_08455 [Deltaproteobacteria bacterium]|nr:hypothetical protein [Deltaproteobacteria bacterium]